MRPPVQPWRDHLSDGRSNGSMAQFTRRFLVQNPTGWTRKELRLVLRAEPAFSQQFERNPGAYLHMIRRLLLRGDILDREGMLFASERLRLAILVRGEVSQINRDFE